MNKRSTAKLSCFLLVMSVMPINAIIEPVAQAIKSEIDKEAKKRNKFASRPIWDNIPFLSQVHATASGVVGVKSIYQTVSDAPATIADAISDNTIINEIIKLLIKVPLKTYALRHATNRGVIYEGMTSIAANAINDKTGLQKRLPKSVVSMVMSVKGTVEGTVEGILKPIKNNLSEEIQAKMGKAGKDIAFDLVMGDRPSIAGVIYDVLVHGQIAQRFEAINDPLGGEKLYKAYAKAIFCKLCQPVEDRIYGYLRQKIDQAAKED